MKRFAALFLSSLFIGSLFAVSPTNTLPVVYVNTLNRQAINDTEKQIPATVYIDPLNTGYDSLATKDSPVEATVKGRGNWTWNGFDKKPYKIKFSVKHPVLGMPNNRHWCLMAGADDYLGFLKNPTGYFISQAAGLRWTPRMVPVELVLNGTYMGLYFLTEHVRIASHRVKITEQNNRETHADSITGGWLVEIDNYRTENNIEFDEGNGQHVMVSLREPDTLSSSQRNYLEHQLHALNEALYGDRFAALEQILDIREAAKYYLVQEIMEDCESYHGSCFLYKDRDSLGVADKWKFGPVWDFGNAYDRHQELWIYEHPTWPQYWIGQLAQWPEFQKAVQEEWYRFYHDRQDSVRAQIVSLAALITAAAQRDAQVWNGSQGYHDNSDMKSRKNDLLYRYEWRIQWLYSQWGEGIRPATYDIETASGYNEPKAAKILRNGHVFILRGGKRYTLTGTVINPQQ